MDHYRKKTEEALERIANFDQGLNAIIITTPDEAREAAAASDAALAEGSSRGLLDGLVVTVKDNIDMSGHAATAGAKFLADTLSPSDAPVVERLKRAGAIIVGKANLAELAFGSRSYSAVGGQCRNPWDTARIPGGSSGGSAVAIAADFCEGSLGTDTGGSVRLPACFNGVSGLRPTHGRVPNRGVVPVSAHNDTVGPLARRVEDVARLFAVIAGYDSKDPTSVDMPLSNFVPTLHDGIAGLKIGVPRQHYFETLSQGVGEAVQAAIGGLEKAGAVIVDVDLPLAGDAHAHMSRMIFSDVCSVFGDRLREAPETITESVVERMRNGFEVTGIEYAEGAAFRSAWRQQLRSVFSTVDIIATPTAPVTAPLIEDGASLLAATAQVTRNTYAGAIASIPGLSIPCGFDPQKLPIGLQLEAAWWQEPVLFRAGIAYQKNTEFHLERPVLN